MKKTDSDYCYYVVRTNIKKYRKLRKITSQKLADLTDLKHQYIRDLECLSLIRRPRLDTIYRIANALDVKIKDLLDDEDIKL